MDRLFRIVFWFGKFVIFPVGVLMLAGAGYKFLDTRAWLARSIEAQGSVIEMVSIRDRDTGSLTFAPLVRFRTAEGRMVDFQSTFSSNPPAHSAGETVTVLYDPARPASAAISGFFSIWFGTMILGIIGAVFATCGLGAAIVRPRHLRLV